MDSRSFSTEPDSSTAEPVRVLNLQAVDICNSRCVMCNIWKDGKREMLSLEELRELFSRPFFSEVTHVGITGGEPTLRKDLVDIYRMLPDVFPKLVGASFISHGMQTERAVGFYTQVHEHYRGLNLRFDGMISLDGVDEVHDRVRGRKGAFDAASRTLLELKARGVSVMAACTIVRRNVYGLHDLLEWGKAHGIYVRYRVAEYIRRLYNESCTDEIRSFSPRELRHVVSFFHLLLGGYEKEETIRKTYRSILSLLTGGERLISCPYQVGRALNVDSRGAVACCAPKGTALALPSDTQKAAALLQDHRAEVKQQHCASCIHDYHDNWTAASRAQLAQAEQRRRDLYELSDESLNSNELPAKPLDLARWHRVLLAGWYGTETAGDIAILRGIISEYLAVNPGLRFVVLSLFPSYTRTTMTAWPADLQACVETIDYDSEEAWQATEHCDAVVMAGGPLMDIQETRKILCLFKRFADLGKQTIIEGCGIGPLHRSDYRWNVCRIARLATYISVRDSASRDLLRLYGIKKSIDVRLDPAVTFLRNLNVHHHGGDGKVIRCFLRELTREYPQGITAEQATANLVSLLKRLLEWYPEHRIELGAMHHFPVGNDDRIFAQQLVRAVDDSRLTMDWEPRTPEEIVEAMAAADFCVCMRFHSCVFATEVDVPFLAIDYTAGGKIQGYLEDVGQEKRLCRLSDIGRLDHAQFQAKTWLPNPGVGVAVPAETPRRPMVLHVIEAVTGGGGSRAMISLARDMRKCGSADHCLLSVLPADAAGLTLAQQAGLEVLNHPCRRDLIGALAAADVVLVHWWNAPELAELFCRELPPMRLVLWLHVGGYHAPQVVTPSLIEFADLAVACSPHTYAHPAFTNLAPEVRAQRTAMVLAGADFDRLAGLGPRAHQGFCVGYIGTLSPVKMHTDYVAMSCAVRVPDVKFVVCGYGDMRWLQQGAQQRGRSESFEFRGPVEDIRSVLEELDVYGYPLCPDTYAAAELNLQEAMFAGLPVVAFPYGGIGKLIRHGETGWLVNSAEEYALAIEHLHEHPEERARLGANAAAFARKHWGAEQAARKFQELLDGLLREPKQLRHWRHDNVPLASDLIRELAIYPGARMFIESLGGEGSAFLTSVAQEQLEAVFEAERHIARMSRQVHYACAIRYRRMHPADPFINLWSGLAWLHMGQAKEALACFDMAHRAGLNHWRILWYRAQAAEKVGKISEVQAALQNLLRVAPNFAPAREMLRRFDSETKQDRAPAAVAQELVQQSQRLLAAGQFAEARGNLARALLLMPGQLILMELVADLDCRLGNFDSAAKLHEAILRREPRRATPRLQAVQQALRTHLARANAATPAAH